MLYVKNLHKSYEMGKNKYAVLKGIDLHVAQGEFVAVMGAFGFGENDTFKLYFLLHSL